MSAKNKQKWRSLFFSVLLCAVFLNCFVFADVISGSSDYKNMPAKDYTGIVAGRGEGMCAAAVRLKNLNSEYKVNKDPKERLHAASKKLAKCLDYTREYAIDFKKANGSEKKDDVFSFYARKCRNELAETPKIKLFPLEVKSDLITSFCLKDSGDQGWKEYAEANAQVADNTNKKDVKATTKAKARSGVDKLSGLVFSCEAEAFAFVRDPFDVVWDVAGKGSLKLTIPVGFEVYASGGKSTGSMAFSTRYENYKYLPLPTSLPEDYQEAAAVNIYKLCMTLADSSENILPEPWVKFDSHGHFSQSEDEAFSAEVVEKFRDDDQDGLFSMTEEASISIGLGSAAGGNSRIFTQDISAADSKDMGAGVWDITPTNGQQNVNPETELGWTFPNDDPNYYFQVWFGSDPNDLSMVVDLPPGVWTGTFVFSVFPMDFETEYFWSIDVGEPNYVDGYLADYILYEGELYSFTTWPENPVIITHPEDVITSEGYQAVFSVDSGGNESGFHTYQWYLAGEPDVMLSDGAEISGSHTATLIIDNVTNSDEGYYFCEVRNVAGVSCSDESQLLTQRLISHWPFDGDLSCSVDINNCGTTDPNQPYYDIGISAMALDSASMCVPVTVINEMYKYYDMSLSMWFQLNDQGTVGTIISTPDAGFVGEIVSAGSIRFLYEGQIVTADVDLEAEQWYHLTIVCDGDEDTTSIYINGEQVGQGHGSSKFNVGPLYIGGFSGWEPSQFSGLIDEVKVYNYPLSCHEIGGLYTEFVSAEFCCSRPDADLNGDCKVGLIDLSMLAEEWLADGSL